MSDSIIDATIDLKDIEDGLLGLSRRATEDTKDFFREIKPEAKKELRFHGLLRRGPRGDWPAPAPASVSRGALKRDSSGRFLKGSGQRSGGRSRNRKAGNLGKITSAWKSFLDPESLKFRQMVRWAAVHNDGGNAGKGGKTPIPARQFAYFSQEFEEKVGQTWAAYVAEGWEKK